MRDRLTIGVVNFSPVWGDKFSNIKKMTIDVLEAKSKGCDFLVFPELCVNGYMDEYLEDGCRMHIALAEECDGETAKYFAEMAKSYDMYIVYGMSEIDSENPNKAYNTVITVTPRGEILPYRKIHPVEGDWCSVGKEPCLIDTPWGKVGISICYDTYAVPELQRYYAAKGARLIVNPTASSRGYDHSVGDNKGWQWYYERRLETLSDRDSVFVASANLTGEDGPIGIKDNKGFCGGSVVIAPKPNGKKWVSQVVGGAGITDEGVFIGNIDLSIATRDLFVGDVYKPELYKDWYANLAALGDISCNDKASYDKISIAVSNFEVKWGNKTANVALMKKEIEEAALKGANLVLFPEMALTGYVYKEPAYGHLCMQHRLAEAIDGESSRELLELAVKHSIYVIFGMPEVADGRYYNSSAVLCPNGEIYGYRKIHPIASELSWCEAGDSPLLIDTPYGKIGVSICFDTYAIPELARYYAAMGAKVLLNPTATIKGIDRGRWHWYYQSRLEAVSDREGMIVASSNLVGQDGFALSIMKFPGGSVVLGASWSEGIYHAGSIDCNKPGIFVSDKLDLTEIGFDTIGFNPTLYSELYYEVSKERNRQPSMM